MGTTPARKGQLDLYLEVGSIWRCDKREGDVSDLSYSFSSGYFRTASRASEPISMSQTNLQHQRPR